MVNEKIIEQAQESQKVAILPITKIKNYLGMPEIKQRFFDVLGERANAFMASIVNVTAGNDKLLSCEQASIINAAFMAATLDLPIDSNLGFAAIVPFGDKAQFQVMTKGFIQLAIRSAQYENMGVSEVYEDEIKEFNPITGEIFFNDFAECKQRSNEEQTKIVGYYAYFRLVNGFNKSMYMTNKQIDFHAKRYSQTYKKGFGNWVDQKDAMSKKTVIKLLLSKWGILSIDMQKAVSVDQSVIKDDLSIDDYVDNKAEDHIAASSLDNLLNEA